MCPYFTDSLFIGKSGLKWITEWFQNVTSKNGTEYKGSERENRAKKSSVWPLPTRPQEH